MTPVGVMFDGGLRLDYPKRVIELRELKVAL